MDKLESSYIDGGDVKWCSHCRKVFLLPQNVKHQITIWHSNSSLGYIPKGIEKREQADPWMPVFTAALSTMAKRYKQSQSSSTCEWINKTWYITTMEHYSAIEGNKVSIDATTWMNLENIRLSERSQT